MKMPVMFGILMQLMNNDKVTADQLANTFELCKRTVYRYINAISESGIPIVSRVGRYGGLSIMPGYKIKSVYFTEEELARLLFDTKASSISDKLNIQLQNKIGAIGKSNDNSIVLKSNQLVVDTHLAGSGQELLATLKQAIATTKVLHIEYHSIVGEITSRTVEPYSLVLKDNIWYVYCYCRLREGFRYFRTSRIASIMVGGVFTPRQFVVDSTEIEDYTTMGKDMVEFQLAVDKDSLALVEEWLGIHSIMRQDGRYIATATLPYDDWLIRRILGLGKGVTVTNPTKLKKDVYKRCQEIASNYNN